MHATQRRIIRRGWMMAAVALGVLGLQACDTERLLRVDVPGKVPEEALNSADLAATLVASVVSDTECAWDNYVAAAANHSDEYIQSSGNLIMRNWGLRWVPANDPNYAQGTCEGWGYGIYTPLQTARFQSEDVFSRLEEWGASVPNFTALQATVRAYGGYSLVGLAEGFCQMAIDVGPRMTPGDVLAVAESKFSDAMSLASAAGREDLLNMARVGRARVRLDLENFAGAISDASAVPEGFLKNATRDQSDERRYNTHCEMVNCRFWKHASVADNFRDLTIGAEGQPTESDGVADTRVHIMTLGELGFDNATIHYFHDKVTGRDSPVSMASWREAQLIVAEASARLGDVEGARTAINRLRARVGLPTLDLAATQAEMIGLVIEERRREMFAEGGHRLNDMLRFRGTQWEIPFLGEPGSIHPDGFDHTGTPYSDATCFPLPEVETGSNPNT
jgi:hypothetical protein